jgi:hypothetical protein
MKYLFMVAMLAINLGTEAHANFKLLYTAEVIDNPSLPKLSFEVEIDRPELNKLAVRTQARKFWTFDVDGYNYYTCNTDVYFDSGRITIRAKNLASGEAVEASETAMLSVVFSDPTERGSSCFPHDYPSFTRSAIISRAPTTLDSVMQEVIIEQELSGVKFRFIPYEVVGEVRAGKNDQVYSLQNYTPADSVLISTYSPYGVLRMKRKQ